MDIQSINTRRLTGVVNEQLLTKTTIVAKERRTSYPVETRTHVNKRGALEKPYE
jgi:hypothetical protein